MLGNRSYLIEAQLKHLQAALTVNGKVATSIRFGTRVGIHWPVNDVVLYHVNAVVQVYGWESTLDGE